MRPPIVRRGAGRRPGGTWRPAPGRPGGRRCGCRPAGERRGSCAASVRCSAGDLVRVERGGRAGRIEAGPPEDLVGQQVADAGHAALVEQPRLQRRPAGAERGAQLRRATDRERVDAEVADRRVEHHAAEPARVDDLQLAAALERAGRSGSRPASSRPLEYSSRSIGPGAVDEQPTRSCRSAARASGRSVSSSSSLPMRRVPVTVRPVQRAPQGRPPWCPPFRYQASGACDPGDRCARPPARPPAGSTPPRSSRASA